MNTPVLLLTVKEAAFTMKISEREIWRMIARGELVRGKQLGKRATILAESVFRALEMQYHPAPPAPERRKRRRGRLPDAWDEMRARVRAESTRDGLRNR